MSGPLQAATMASARGFEKSLYGRSAAWADKYAYCSGDPINSSDPSGLQDTREQRREADRFFDTVLMVDALHHDAINIEFGGRILGEAFAGLRGLGGRLTSSKLLGGSAASTARTVMISLRTGQGSTDGQMVFVRSIERGEKVDDLISELKTLTFTNDKEYAIVKLRNGTRALVTGSHKQIDFSDEISKLFIHSHPYSEPFKGASPDDLFSNYVLGQRSSWVMDNGQIIKFGAMKPPKGWSYRR